MAIYRYTAKNEKGKTVTGKMQAANEVDLHAKLKQENKFLISAKTEDDKVYIKRMKSQEVSEFCRNISELVGSGVSLVRALKIISEDESIKPKQREVYASLLKLVKSGISLSDAMEQQGDAFPPLMVNMMRSAESTGNLDGVAMQMAIYYEKEHKLNQRVKSAMTYPKMLSILIVIVVAIIMGYVVPQFQSLFDQMEQLPVATTVLLGISEFVKSRWYVLLIGAGIIYVVVRILLKVRNVKRFVDKLELHLPVFGKLRKIIYTARFARTLSSLYSAGISIVNCLAIARTTIGNAYIEEQFTQLTSFVKGGGNLSEAVDQVDGFTKKLSSTIAVGEETGALDGMLSSVATQMEYDSEQAINRMVSYLEPTMIVIMAAVVGFIIVAVIQPIYGSYESIANMS